MADIIDVSFKCDPFAGALRAAGVRTVIRYYTRESGVRSLERELARLARKAVRDIELKKTTQVVVNADNLGKFAGVRKHRYGVADRGASIRVPHSFVNSGYKGYLEDRRPNSQGDPYQIASQILKTIAAVPVAGVAKAA